MPPELTDTTEAAHDLDRVLAEAMSTAALETDSTTPSETPDGALDSEVLKWLAPRTAPRGKDTVIGVDYSPGHLTLIELSPSRQPTILGLQTVKFEQPPEAGAIMRLLEDFSVGGPRRVELALTSARSVVRQFRLPPVPKRRRRAAAIWEAQKLIPFSLNESEAVFGFTFDALKQKGWQVTLAATPREDVSPILDALQKAKWPLQGVSIAGTQWIPDSARLSSVEPTATVGAVLWSPIRACFAVFHEQELRFHYDLGPIPPPVAPPGEAPSIEAIQDWLSTLEKGVAEALEFYTGAQPDLIADRIELFGVSESVAPLLTDWQEHFGIPVALVNPVGRFTAGLPDDIAGWLSANSTAVTTATMAAIGTPTVDITPAALVKTRMNRRGERIARGLFMASIIVAAAWTGLMWMQKSIAARQAEGTLAQLQELKASPINGQLAASLANLRRVNMVSAAATATAKRWMPYLKAIVGTYPERARLISMSVGLPPSQAPGIDHPPTIRLDGKLLPAERPHALTYADWFNRVERIAGEGSVKLVSDRTVEWKGRRSSIFSIEVASTATPRSAP